MVGAFLHTLERRVEGHLRAKGLPESKWAAGSFMTSLNRVVALDQIIRQQ